MVRSSTVRPFACLAAYATLTLLLSVCVSPALAESTYKCEAGSNAAIVNACAARWEAANIRAHVVAHELGDAGVACLTKTEAILEEVALRSLSANKAISFLGAWPCGKQPAIGTASDGILAQACPKKIWSYTNRGLTGCTFSVSLGSYKAEAPSKRVTCDAPNVDPRTVNAVAPEFPPIAQQQGVAGEVVVVVTLNEQSEIVNAKIASSPSALLNNAAIDAAEKSTFQTRIENCKPVGDSFRFMVDFEAK